MFWRGYGNVIGNAPIYGSLISNSSGIWDMVQSYLNPAKSFIQDGLLLHASASNINSYPGTGTTWTDLSGNGNDLTIDVDVDYLTDPINHFSFTDNAGNYIYTGGVIGGLTDMTLDPLMIAYRQALRDIYNNINNLDPWNIDWPTQPQSGE